MSEVDATEVPPSVEVAAEPEQHAGDGEEAPVKAEKPAVEEEPVDMSLLVMVKGKARRPNRPDDQERNLQVGALQERIDTATKRIAEIKAILDARGSSRGTVPPEVQAGRDKIAQLRAEFDTVLLQKKRLNSQNDDKKTERDKLFAEHRQLKDGIRGPSNLAAVEESIARMEYELTHESMSAEREKMVREKKERAEKNDRPAAMRLAQLSAKIDEAKAASDAIRADIAVLNTRLDSIKAAREVEEKKLQDMRSAQQEARSDIPALNVEKKELWEVISALRDKQREIRVAFQAKWDEFKKADRAWKSWYAEERKKRNEARHQEYLERQANRATREKEHKPAKFEHEVYTCEQVLSYLRQFMPAEKAAAGGEKKAAGEVDAPAPGMKLLSRKGDEEAEAMWGSVVAKKGKGARKAAEKQKAAETVKALPKVLPLETLKTFHELGVDAPTGNEDVPKTIAAIEAKKAEYEAKRDKAAAEPPSEEEEPAAAEAGEEEAKATKKPAEAKKAAEAKTAPASLLTDADLTPAEAAGKVPPASAEARKEAAAAAAAAASAKAPGAATAAAAEKAAAAKAAPAAAEAAEANGGGVSPKSEEPDLAVTVSPKKTPAAGDVGVKLRVSDAGDVNVEVSV